MYPDLLFVEPLFKKNLYVESNLLEISTSLPHYYLVNLDNVDIHVALLGSQTPQGLKRLSSGINITR